MTHLRAGEPIAIGSKNDSAATQVHEGLEPQHYHLAEEHLTAMPSPPYPLLE